MTRAMIFSADDGCGVGEDSGVPIFPDHGSQGKGFQCAVKRGATRHRTCGREPASPRLSGGCWSDRHGAAVVRIRDSKGNRCRCDSHRQPSGQPVFLERRGASGKLRGQPVSDKPRAPNLADERARQRNRETAERPLTASVRTALALIEFGFGIAKLDAYVRRAGLHTRVDRLHRTLIFVPASLSREVSGCSPRPFSAPASSSGCCSLTLPGMPCARPLPPDEW